nr:undecaprenyl diphosphate synthase family protein [Spirochaetales bacterium]
LLWESAYSELYFSSKLWPDFTPDDFLEALMNYQSRNRKYGGVV